jgi:hypothetical protein
MVHRSAAKKFPPPLASAGKLDAGRMRSHNRRPCSPASGHTRTGHVFNSHQQCGNRQKDQWTFGAYAVEQARHEIGYKQSGEQTDGDT